MGSEFDINLVKSIAKYGRGFCSEVKELADGQLSKAVVRALGFATYPSYENCRLNWVIGGRDETEELNEVFNN